MKWPVQRILKYCKMSRNANKKGNSSQKKRAYTVPVMKTRYQEDWLRNFEK